MIKIRLNEAFTARAKRRRFVCGSPPLMSTNNINGDNDDSMSQQGVSEADFAPFISIVGSVVCTARLLNTALSCHEIADLCLRYGVSFPNRDHGRNPLDVLLAELFRTRDSYSAGSITITRDFLPVRISSGGIIRSPFYTVSLLKRSTRERNEHRAFCDRSMQKPTD
jgi:hypothetical protein